MSQCYPLHIQNHATRYSFCSCFTVHCSFSPSQNKPDKDTRTAHREQAYWVFYAVQHRRWHHSKTNEVPVWVPPFPTPVSWSSGCQNQKEMSRVLGHGESCCGWPSRWGKRKVSLLHNLNDILVLQCMVFTHFLRIVFHRETPDQSTVSEEKKKKKKIQSVYIITYLLPYFLGC